MDDIETFLLCVKRELAVLREARRRYEARLAPDFNALSYDPTDEMRLSRLLADLLNPKGRHGQGDRFLRTFLTDVCRLPAHKANTDEAKVTTEDVVDGNRRPDVVLRLKETIIIIENKPWAGDQPNQVADYSLWLSKQGRAEWLILYLTGDGHDPSEKSIPTDEWKKYEQARRGRAISYRANIICWLQGCMGLSESERVQFYMGEFLDFLRRQFKEVPDMTTEDSIRRLVLEGPESPKNLEAAIQIGGALPEIKRNLLRELTEQLSAIAKKKGMRAANAETKSMNLEKFSGITIELDGNGKHQFSWELIVPTV